MKMMAWKLGLKWKFPLEPRPPSPFTLSTGRSRSIDFGLWTLNLGLYFGTSAILYHYVLVVLLQIYHNALSSCQNHQTILSNTIDENPVRYWSVIKGLMAVWLNKTIFHYLLFVWHSFMQKRGKCFQGHENNRCLFAIFSFICGINEDFISGFINFL